MRNVIVGMCFLWVLITSALCAADGPHEGVVPVPYDPAMIRDLLKVEAGPEGVEIREEHIKEWEECGDLWRTVCSMYMTAMNEKRAGALAATLPLFEQVSSKLSELNPFQMLVKLLEYNVLVRFEDVERAKSEAFSNYDLLVRIRAGYDNTCPFVDRLFVTWTLAPLGKLKGMTAKDVEAVDRIYAYWCGFDDVQIRLNAFNHRASLWRTNEPPDLEKAVEYKKEFFRLLPELVGPLPGEAEQEKNTYSTVTADQIDFAHQCLLKKGRKDLAQEFVMDVEIPARIADKHRQDKLDEIRSED